MSRASRLTFVPPQLLSLTEQPPQGDNWLHEVKHDGYRTQLVIKQGIARAYTRSGFDWSDRYARVVAEAATCPADPRSSMASLLSRLF